MYNINEIPFQNMQDYWSMMYMYVSRSLVDNCGTDAQGAIRTAVRRMCEARGKELRFKHVNANVKTNLLNLYEVGQDYTIDPRMHEEIICKTEQVLRWEVWNCPLADLWNKAGENELGKLYCEENQHALLKGYTNAKGQMNLSKILTCVRDNHCCFAAYYRPANLSGEQRKESFAYPSEEPKQIKPLSNASFQDGIKSQFIKTIYYLLETADECYASEGVCALAHGLHNFSDAAVFALKSQADRTLNACDKVFVKNNFPISLDAKEDDLWEKYGGNNTRQIVQVNLLDRIKTQLKLD